ncbi:MAG: magnesium-translocating P-type ATPase [Christensenellales bacterium]|jgi:Mg2+-importing ATPase
MFGNRGKRITRANKRQLMQELLRRDNLERLMRASRRDAGRVLSAYRSNFSGLTEEQVEKSRDMYGENVVEHGKKTSMLRRILQVLADPFILVLVALAAVSFVTDVWLAAPGQRDYLTVVIILSMVAISGALRFVQEQRSGRAAEKLTDMIETTTNVQRRESGKREIPLDEVVVGDIVHLAAGDMVPADVRILSCKDLFVRQSALTGESEPVEKHAEKVGDDYDQVIECPNLAFMGTDVISGTAACMVLAVGADTQFGSVAASLAEPRVKTTFEKGVSQVSWLLIRFMLVMVPVVLFINGFTKGDWMAALLFAISVAVGLTPEMLPMIVSTCLSKGAVAMSRKKTVVKNLNSIQSFGAMDVLCTDKTGTLTQDKVVLEYGLDVLGNEDLRVIRHAFLNSYYQTGLKNLMDIAIIRRTNEEAEGQGWGDLSTRYEKVDEVPFDFNRRRMSVVVEDKSGKRQMITKGAVEEMLECCAYCEYKGRVLPLTQELKQKILVTADDLNDDGLRVIAVAQKTNPSPVGTFSVADESDMVLMGYLAFLDPPKESTQQALEALSKYGVTVKVLTGDNDRVTRAVCRHVGLESERIILGSDIESMADEKLKDVLEKYHIFAKLSPEQKARLVTMLRENGHTVGYMGDGINDAAAMRVSDVGISVDTAVDIAKESADVILLEKDLMVLEEGVIEGRKTYANMMKYIKLTASSNFGNVLSVVLASILLPFLPMAALHLLLLNLIYDVSCTAIPWDNVDEEMIKKPRQWNASGVASFMLWMGPISSIFDIATFLVMYFLVCPLFFGGLTFTHLTDPGMRALYVAVFQAGWFVESMWSQTLVIHMIRTAKIPFLQSRASFTVTTITFAGIILLTLIPFTAFGAMIDLAPLPGVYFSYLAAIVISYMALITLVKRRYVKKYGELL